MSLSVANYKIQLNGTDLPQNFMSCIDEIVLEDEINLPAMFSIKINMINIKEGKWQGIDLKDFKPGDKITVSIGLDKVEEFLKGEITAMDLSLSDYSQLEIRGYDLLHRLRMGTRNKVFTKKKDSEIASEIAKEHGLTAEVEDTKTVYPYIFQNNQSNYEFLLQRAGRIDYEVYVEDKKLYFIKSRAKKDPSIPELTYKKDFEELTLELKALTRGSKVEVHGWDVKDKKEIEAQAKKGDEATKMGGKESGFELSAKALEESPIAIWGENLIDLSEAKNVAIATYNSLLREFISGEVKCHGNNALRAGKTVKLLGIDERFSGVYYIISTVHSINSNGYMTNFKMKRAGI